MGAKDKQALKPQNDINETEKFFRDIEIEFLIHELKDPISVIETGIRSMMERQEKFGSLTPRQERILNRTLRNSKKARDMLHGLLEIGRSESGCFICCRFKPFESTYDALLNSLETSAAGIYEQCQPGQGMERVLRCLADNGIFIDVVPPAAEIEVLQDEVKFRQIVGNLVKNALQYFKNRMEIHLSSDDDMFYLEVADDGPGIGWADHEHIFRRYAQVDACSLTPRKGHGLGLAGARIMARCLGGDIGLIRHKGKGAIFKLSLPLDLNAVVE